MSDLTGKCVRLRDQQGVAHIGRAIAYIDEPSYPVELPDGDRVAWNYCLTERATWLDRVVFYLRNSFIWK